jgi:outer membrane protein assembly factor BamE (lipoprotein component of BamABCDE complex)
MMINRFAYVVAAIVVTFLLIGCQTAQISKSTESGAPSAKAESPKDTQTVKGINDWEGEISGTPAPGSNFTRLKIGMSMRQVTDLIGGPTDMGSYVTGKAWIPFYYGSDRYRYEMLYRGQGRLIFAGGHMGDPSGHLISIIHNARESGYR